MKKNFWHIVTLCSLVLLVVCLFQILQLKQEVQNLRHNLSYEISNMESNMVSNTAHIQTMLEKEASILAKSEWSYGKVNQEDYTIEVKCSVTPKEYDPENTQAVITYEGREVPMELVNGEYIANIPVSLFSDTVIGQVMFLEDGKIRAEGLDWNISPYYDHLPYVHTHFSGGGSGSTEDEAYIWSRQGTLEIYVEKKGADSIMQEAAMIRYIDGKEIERTEIPLEEYAEDLSNILYDLDVNYPIPFGSTQDIYVEFVDENELHYRVQIEHTVIGEDGTPEDDGMMWDSSENVIYDKEGNELYRGYW